ncbi:hypothetical protein OG896_02960 [Streptomyces sp. NBC_00669]|uniref:hypothetical protein n=1 Tax=Streptomyces sp. NBC_00669 TaxID=2976011 RepID=UPI002E30F8FB|nr:hypothetical protein [Streptomyces sp. NBC_00669]
MVRLANVGRSLLMAAVTVAADDRAEGMHGRGLAYAGVSSFLGGLLVFQGGDWWSERRKRDRSDPVPPIPHGGGTSGDHGAGDPTRFE